MILKALYDYYHRSGDNVAPLGPEYKEIGFIIVIDKDGNLCRIEDNPVKKLVAKTIISVQAQKVCLIIYGIIFLMF